jgi:hypothetical protein
MNPKRIVVMADTHCGHRVGLTPPAWQDSPTSGPVKRRRHAKFQKQVWDFYARTLDELQPIDDLFVVGDAVDGKGERSGGTEQLTLARTEQVDMAATCIAEAKAKKIYMIYGTAYHTGQDDDWEDLVADKVGAEISGHDWITVGKTTFDLKHHLGGSTIPHGRFTAIARDALWNLVWAADGRQPQADVIIRAHVHYFVYFGDGQKVGIVLPALQGYGSKFGIRRCSGTVSIGLVHFDVYDDGRYSWHPHLLDSALLRIRPKRG